MKSNTKVSFNIFALKPEFVSNSNLAFTYLSDFNIYSRIFNVVMFQLFVVFEKSHIFFNSIVLL